LREWSRDGSIFIDSCVSVDFPPCTCFIMNNIVRHKSSIEWNSVRLRV
jgi:hypothetical protein